MLATTLMVALAAIAPPVAAQDRASPPASTGTWHTYVPEGAPFHILVAGQPKTEAVETKSDDGTPLPSRTVAFASDGVEYIAGFTQFPGGLLTPDVNQSALDGARDGAVAEVSGTLRTETRLTIDNQPARHIIVDLPGGTVMVGRFVIAGDRLIQAAASGTRGTENRADVERFLNSLRLSAQ